MTILDISFRLFRYFTQKLDEETVRADEARTDENENGPRLPRNPDKPKKDPATMVYFDTVFFKRGGVVSEAHEVVSNDPIKLTMNVRPKSTPEHQTDQNTPAIIQVSYAELIRKPIPDVNRTPTKTPSKAGKTKTPSRTPKTPAAPRKTTPAPRKIGFGFGEPSTSTSRAPVLALTDAVSPSTHNVAPQPQVPLVRDKYVTLKNRCRYVTLKNVHVTQNSIL